MAREFNLSGSRQRRCNSSSTAWGALAVLRHDRVTALRLRILRCRTFDFRTRIWLELRSAQTDLFEMTYCFIVF